MKKSGKESSQMKKKTKALKEKKTIQLSGERKTKVN